MKHLPLLILFFVISWKLPAQEEGAFLEAENEVFKADIKAINGIYKSKHDSLLLFVQIQNNRRYAYNFAKVDISEYEGLTNKELGEEFYKRYRELKRRSSDLEKVKSRNDQSFKLEQSIYSKLDSLQIVQEVAIEKKDPEILKEHRRQESFYLLKAQELEIEAEKTDKFYYQNFNPEDLAIYQIGEMARENALKIKNLASDKEIQKQIKDYGYDLKSCTLDYSQPWHFYYTDYYLMVDGVKVIKTRNYQEILDLILEEIPYFFYYQKCTDKVDVFSSWEHLTNESENNHKNKHVKRKNFEKKLEKLIIPQFVKYFQ